LFGQDGWILAKLFFSVFKDQDGVEVHKYGKIKGDQYPAILTEQAWSIKDLLHTAGNPGRARWHHPITA